MNVRLSCGATMPTRDGGGNRHRNLALELLGVVHGPLGTTSVETASALDLTVQLVDGGHGKFIRLRFSSPRDS